MAHDYYLGIDPGKQGALALTAPEGFLATWDTPLVEAKGVSLYDELAMVALLRQAIEPRPPGSVLVVVERVHAMPKQGVSSSFNFGMGYGLWRGMVAALGVPSVLVDPRTWGRVSLADVPKGDPAAAAAAAMRWYPQAAEHLRTPRGRVLDGRVDALLLAHYGRVAGL